MRNKFKFFSTLLACAFFFSVFNVSPKAIETDAKSTQDTELVFVVDKSGSMGHIADDTIGSFNSVIEEQKKIDKEDNVYVTTVMFNQSSVKIHERKDIKDIEKITNKEYRPSGCTALLDAVGNTIVELSQNEAIKNNKVMFVIITDGYENSSKKFKRDEVKKLIDEKTKENWQFVFLGANIDSVKESGSLGIKAKYTRNFVSSSNGVSEAFSYIGNAIDQIRSSGEINLDRVKYSAENTISVKSEK